MEFTGVINDIATGEQIKKSYQNGYSYKSMMSLARCDICMVRPERCHFHQGTCREPEWGKKHCFIPHIVYLSITGQVKVGITRITNTPGRWIDQGASLALPLLKVRDRLTSGMIEKEIAQEYRDKTNWKEMLAFNMREDENNLLELRERIFYDYSDLLDDLDAVDMEEEIIKIDYPVLEIPKVMKSLSFDNSPVIEGKLLGIKGQYLLFEQGVLGIRKHQGYFLEISYNQS